MLHDINLTQDRMKATLQCPTLACISESLHPDVFDSHKLTFVLAFFNIECFSLPNASSELEILEQISLDFQPLYCSQYTFKIVDSVMFMSLRETESING